MKAPQSRRPQEQKGALVSQEVKRGLSGLTREGGPPPVVLPNPTGLGVPSPRTKKPYHCTALRSSLGGRRRTAVFRCKICFALLGTDWGFSGTKLGLVQQAPRPTLFLRGGQPPKVDDTSPLGAFAEPPASAKGASPPLVLIRPTALCLRNPGRVTGCRLPF